MRYSSNTSTSCTTSGSTTSCYSSACCSSSVAPVAAAYAGTAVPAAVNGAVWKILVNEGDTVERSTNHDS